MADENPQQYGTKGSSSTRKVYPDSSVLGGEIGLWSSDLNEQWRSLAPVLLG